MTLATVNGSGIYYARRGESGPPLVLVHGSWDSHRVWDRVAPILAQSFRVVAYDRRGHGASESPGTGGSMREDAADLAALIEHLELAPAWVAASSFGGSIALRLAGDRPELLRGIVAHEPPLFGLLADDPVARAAFVNVRRQIESVAARIAAGDHAGGAEEFMERVALGPGAWARIAPEGRKAIVAHAPTFLDEARDPEQLAFDLERLRRYAGPVLFTLGELSPPIYLPVITRLAPMLHRAKIVTLSGAGHVPHITHSAAYADAIVGFVHETCSPPAGPGR